MGSRAEVVVLHAPTAHVASVLYLFEHRGFQLVGLKACAGTARIALRACPDSAADAPELCAALQRSLPTGASVESTSSTEEALSVLHAHFSARELVQWADDGPGSLCATVPMGDPCDHREAFWVSDLLGPSARSGAGGRFCAQLRRDGYVPLLLSSAHRAIFERVELAAARWFEQPEDAKLDQAGAYAHVDRKFTGYRAGKFREQLEVRPTSGGGCYPGAELGGDFGGLLRLLLAALEPIARALLVHVADDVGVTPDFFNDLLDPPPYAERGNALAPAGPGNQVAEDIAELLPDAAAMDDALGKPASPQSDTPPSLCHSLVRVCRYDADAEGVYGSDVLCEAHNDVGFITLDACASSPGLHALRRSDGLWVPIEEVQPRDDGAIVVLAMVGDTLSRLTADYYPACKHRVVAPPAGERIGLPFLFRGRSDAVLNTAAARANSQNGGRHVHLAEMETTTIKELPAFDSAKSILRNWFKSVKK